MDDENKNSTEFGEFVCSYFSWLPLEIQKEKAIRLSDITNEKGEVKKYEKEKYR